MRGKVECEEADVAGSFEGMEMTAHNRLTLSDTARVGGKVSNRHPSTTNAYPYTTQTRRKHGANQQRVCAIFFFFCVSLFYSVAVWCNVCSRASCHGCLLSVLRRCMVAFEGKG